MAKKRNRRATRRGRAAPVRAQPPRTARGKPSPTAGPEPTAAWPPASAESPKLSRLRARTVGGDAWLGHIEDQVVVLVNEARRRHGCPRLRGDERLRAAARSHSADMRARGYLAHQAPDGGTPSDRMRTAGYSWPAAENIACGQQRPHEVMHAWMNSPGHRANILNPRARAVGVGLDPGPGGPWWTQNFGYE